MTRLLVHVAEPDGTITVSPAFALDTAARTSENEGLAAINVFVAEFTRKQLSMNIVREKRRSLSCFT